MVVLTIAEQKLLISILDRPTSSKNQKVYKQTVSFYDAIWKLRDMGLVTNTEQPDRTKLWKLTVDGIVMARILKKEI